MAEKLRSKIIKNFVLPDKQQWDPSTGDCKSEVKCNRPKNQLPGSAVVISNQTDFPCFESSSKSSWFWSTSAKYDLTWVAYSKYETNKNFSLVTSHLLLISCVFNHNSLQVYMLHLLHVEYSTWITKVRNCFEHLPCKQ